MSVSACSEADDWKILSHHKKGVLGPFCHLLNKVKVYEAIEVKVKLVVERETIAYWDHTDMSRFCCYLYMMIVDLI